MGDHAIAHAFGHESVGVWHASLARGSHEFQLPALEAVRGKSIEIPNWLPLARGTKPFSSRRHVATTPWRILTYKVHKSPVRIMAEFGFVRVRVVTHTRIRLLK
jgi:hypothetical protein